jgi:serine protease Do
MAASLGTATEKGAIVANVVEGSPAEKAGFKQGDVILTLNGNSVDDSRDLTRKVASLIVGQQANFAILRDGQRRNIVATIAKRDEQQIASADRPAPQANRGNGGAKETSMTSLGMELVPLSNESRSQYNIDSDVTAGVVVNSVDDNSEAADKGFRPGDVIVSIGNKTIRTLTDVEQGIADAKKAGRESVLLLVSGDQGQHYIALKIAKS